MAGAIMLYPGGTVFDPQSVGFAWENYFCDLTHGHTKAGQDNPAAPLAQAGMVCFGLALYAVCALGIARLTLTPGWRRFLRVNAVGSALGIVGVTLVSYESAPRFHFLVTFLAGPCGVAAVIGLAWQLRKQAVGGVLLDSLGGLTVVAALFGLVVYLRQSFLGGAETALLPVTQKVVALCVTLWIATSAIALGRRGKAALR